MTTLNNVLMFPHGEPLEERFPEFDGLGEEDVFDLEPTGTINLVSPEQTKNILDRLSRLRLLVEQGRIGSLVIVGQDPVTGYFLTETCLDPATGRTEHFGLVGVLETLKLELTEQAALSPVIDLTGAVVDPYFEADE